MARRILVIDRHPDKDRGRFCHALAQAYVDSALEAGEEARLITLADADFPLLRSNADFAKPPEAPAILAARDDIRWADHLVFVFRSGSVRRPRLCAPFWNRPRGRVPSRGLARTGFVPR